MPRTTTFTVTIEVDGEPSEAYDKLCQVLREDDRVEWFETLDYSEGNGPTKDASELKDE